MRRGAGPVLAAPHLGLCDCGGSGQVGGTVFAFLSLSQATKPDTWGQNYSSHHAARPEEEGAPRAAKETRRGRKHHLLASTGERERQVSNR